MFSVMMWNVENLERPAANAEQAVKDRYARKLQQIAELITGARPDLVGVQEVLADPRDLAPRAFEDLLAALGAQWTGRLSQRPDPRLADPVACSPSECTRHYENTSCGELERFADGDHHSTAGGKRSRGDRQRRDNQHRPHRPLERPHRLRVLGL